MEHKTVTAADNKFSKSFPFCWEVGTHSIPSAAVNRILDPSRPSFRPSLLQARWSDRNLPTFTPRSDPNEGRVRWESGGAHCPHDERKEWDDNEPLPCPVLSSPEGRLFDRTGGDERGNDTHSLWSIGLLVPSLISFIIRGGNCEVSLMSRAGTTGNSDSLPQFARRPFSLPSVTHVLGRLRLTRAWRGKKEIHIIYATQWAPSVPWVREESEESKEPMEIEKYYIIIIYTSFSGILIS